MPIKALLISAVVTLLLLGACGNPRRMGVELMAAVKAAEMDKAANLIRAGADTELIDSDDKTVLEYVEEKGYSELVEMITAARLNVQDSTGKTPLMRAIEDDRLEDALAIIRVGVDVNLKDGNNETALRLAVLKQSLSLVEALLEKGADANVASQSYGWTPLHTSVAMGNIPITELLLASGADVNAKDNGDTTPLYRAANGKQAGHERLAQMLLEAGANVDDFILRQAIYNRKSDMVVTLLDYGAKLNSKVYGESPLGLAAAMGELETLDILIKSGARLNDRSDSGYTPLMNAVASGQKDAVERMLEAGARLDVKTSSAAGDYYKSKTALMLAEMFDKKEIAEILTKAEKRIR